MKAFGCELKNKKVFLALIQAHSPRPNERDKVARKRAQSRLSELSRALEGARLQEIAPGELVEALKEEGGVEAFAKYAREHKAEGAPPTRAAGGRAAGGRPTSRQAAREQRQWGRHDATGRSGHTRGHRPTSRQHLDEPAQKVAVGNAREDAVQRPATTTIREVPLWMEPELADRLMGSNGEVEVTIDVDRSTDPPRLELVDC